MEIPKKRGFATMTIEQRQEIAAMGGRAVPAERRSFALDKALTASAGKKGGKSLAPEKRSFSVSRLGLISRPHAAQTARAEDMNARRRIDA
jgi:general stress protein YciG